MCVRTCVQSLDDTGMVGGKRTEIEIKCGVQRMWGLKNIVTVSQGDITEQATVTPFPDH